MTKFNDKTFQVGGYGRAYSEGWERTFGKAAKIEKPPCDGPAHNPPFDEEWCINANPTSWEVRARYPRLTCEKCRTVCYASVAHIVWGDW